MPKISFIIVNYSTKDLLIVCINNLLKVSIDHEIIVVDNDSIDNSYREASKRFKNHKNIILIKNINNGIAAGYNLAKKQAKSKVHIYLGTDAFPTNDAINKIYDYLIENSDVGIVSPHLYTRDGKSDLDAHRGFPTPWVSFTHFSGLEKLFKKSKIFGGYNLLYKDLNTTHEIDAGISHFFAVNTKVYEKVKDWDESFFMFGEDIDFCYRVKQAGFKVMYLGKIKVLHYKGASIGRNTSLDIKNAINLDFDNNKDVNDTNTNKEESKNKKPKKINKKVKIKLAKASTFAMRNFYNKHYKKKYNFIINLIVIFSIYIMESIRIIKIKLK